ncbi:hypothetical protein VR46_44300 [Streptomyces sp. NRRL S-444]|nr:hypothetical protein VR46_44300 [Streptomyces sp. NRRL S-444]
MQQPHRLHRRTSRNRDGRLTGRRPGARHQLPVEPRTHCPASTPAAPAVRRHLEPVHRPGTRTSPFAGIGLGLREPPPHHPLQHPQTLPRKTHMPPRKPPLGPQPQQPLHSRTAQRRERRTLEPSPWRWRWRWRVQRCRLSRPGRTDHGTGPLPPGLRLHSPSRTASCHG